MPSEPGLQLVTSGDLPVARFRGGLPPISCWGERGGQIVPNTQPTHHHQLNIAHAVGRPNREDQGAASGALLAWTTGSAPAMIAFFCSAR